MQFAVSVLTTWIVIIIFCLMPKKLTGPEMVLLFFVNSIFAISIFTTVELNLQYVTIADNVDRKFAAMVGHMVEAPILLVMTSNVVLYRNPLRWCLPILLWLVLFASQYTMKWIGVLIFVQWNVFRSAVENASFVVFAVIATFIVKWISGRDVNPRASVR